MSCFRKKKKLAQKLVLTPEEMKLYNVTEQQVQEYRDAFNLFDRDGSETIEVHELGHVLHTLGQSYTETQLQKIVKEIDKDGAFLVAVCTFLWTQICKFARIDRVGKSSSRN